MFSKRERDVCEWYFRLGSADRDLLRVRYGDGLVESMRNLRFGIRYGREYYRVGLRDYVDLLWAGELCGNESYPKMESCGMVIEEGLELSSEAQLEYQIKALERQLSRLKFLYAKKMSLI